MSQRPNYFPALLLAVPALAIAASLALHLIPGQGFVGLLLATPGRVLFQMLLWAAWWVPLYFLLLSWMSLSPPRINRANLVILNVLTIPVVTLAVLLQLAGGDTSIPLVAAISRSFTIRGGMLIVSLILALEALALLQIPRLLSGPGTIDGTDDGKIRALPEPEPVDEEPPADEKVADDESSADELPADEHTDDEHTDDEYAVYDEEIDDEHRGGLASWSPYQSYPEASAHPEDDDEVIRLDFGAGSETSLDDDRDVAGLDDELDDELEDELEDEPVPIALSRKAVRDYHIPVEGVLKQYSNGRYWEIDEVTEHLAEQLKGILEQFGIEAEVTGIRKGPVITMFEILPAPGIKLARITNLADNIAMGLAASSVRIVAPIPGKHAVGIEIPNKRRNTVSFAELMDSVVIDGQHQHIPIALGKDIPGEAQIIDLTRTPHLLIAGATGSGKSVCVNSIICSILYRKNPLEVRLLLIDPKIVELKFYNDIPHLLTPVVTDPKRAFQALQWLLYEMERRYAVLDGMSVRDIVSYNRQIQRKHIAAEPLPFIVAVIDEFADLMASSGKELESTVARLAAMSRAVGIHLVLATQRPSTDVITGLIKANIPSRIAFAVAQKVDSRIILDAMGADKLLGQGDMLFTSSWDPFPVRIQGAFVSDEEVERIVEEVKRYGEPDYIDDEIFFEEEEELFSNADLEDPLMDQAVEIVLSARKASASYLQRRLKVGYNRAARMVEEMERIGIVGPQNGSKPREVIGSG